VRWFLSFHVRPSRTKFAVPRRPGSALRHWEVADCHEVADSVDVRTCPQKTGDIDATPLMTPTTALGLSIRLSMCELRETGDWDIFLGPPERARAETGGADQWVLKRRELPGVVIVNEKKTPASLGYTPSVFKKNCTFKTKKHTHTQ